MITVTEFIEKVDAIMGQKNMDKWYFETKKDEGD